MTLVRNRAGSSKKKKKRGKKKNKFLKYVIFSIVFLLLVLSAWIIFTRTSFFGTCLEVKKSFFIESACNLNENEVEVVLGRGSDDINLERIKLEFQDSGSLWKIDGAKCLDVRLKENKYGNYCELIGERESKSYALNLSLGKQQSVEMFVQGNGRNCNVEKKEIGESC